MPRREAVSEPEAQVRTWVRELVIGLNLCPFAVKEWRRNSIRYRSIELSDLAQLLTIVESEINYLQRTPEVETSLLIATAFQDDFEAFLEFVDLSEALIEQGDHQQFVQLASFHPRYQFAETPRDSVENYTNRAPWPVLHLLRVESVTAAIEAHPDTEQIPARNIRLMHDLGCAAMQAKLDNCR